MVNHLPNGVKNSLIEGKYKISPIKNEEYANKYNENKNNVLNKNMVDKILCFYQ